MCGFELGKELPRRPHSSLFRVFQALANTLFRVGSRGHIQQALIGLGILHDHCGPPTVSTMGRLLFLRRLMMSLDERRNVQLFDSVACQASAPPRVSLNRCSKDSASPRKRERVSLFQHKMSLKERMDSKTR